MRVPLELIVQIIDHILVTKSCHQKADKPGESTKAPWALIEPLTRASKGFRQLSISKWFYTLFLRSSSDMEDIDRFFPFLKDWCRHLHCVQIRDRSTSLLWDLAGFRRLKSLRVDWLSMGTVSSPFLNVESKIKELDIRGLRHPSPLLIDILTFPFVDLVTLRLDCMKIWCGLCNTSNLVRFPSPHPEGSPTSFVYEDGLGLPYIYSRYFLRLQNLEEVFIRLPDVGPRHFTPGLSARANDNFWTGECDRCMEWMYRDEEFRKKWVNKKKGLLPLVNLEKEERSVYRRPPRLRKVYWSFWKLNPSTNDGSFTQDDIDSDEEYPGTIEDWP